MYLILKRSMKSSKFFALTLLRSTILVAVLATLVIDNIIIHDLNQLPAVQSNLFTHFDRSIPALRRDYFQMLLVPDFITIAILVCLPIGKSLFKGNAFYTISRVFSAIGLVALTIYRPLIYVAQLQDQLNRYKDEGVQISFSQGYKCNAGYGNLEDDYGESGTDFCSIFRVRTTLSFVWAFMALAELALAYACDEFEFEVEGGH